MTISPGAEPAIAVRGLVTRFGSQTVHDGLELAVQRGEILGVVGGSGTGKTVLLRTIIGLQRPVAGDIVLLGEPVAWDGSTTARLAGRFGMLFQEGALFSALTVGQNVQVPMRERGDVPKPLMEELTHLKVGLVGLPPDACGKFPAQLSGGMKKRAGLARALALDPEVVFLDEPTAGLDPIGAAAFDELILDLRRALGLTVVMVTHDLDSLARICDRIAVLVDKRIVVGTMAELMRDPHPWIQAYFHGPRARAAFETAAGSGSPNAGQEG